MILVIVVVGSGDIKRGIYVKAETLSEDYTYVYDLTEVNCLGYCKTAYLKEAIDNR